MLKILRTSFVNGSQGRGEREAAIQPTEMIYAPFTVARKGKNRYRLHLAAENPAQKM